MQFDQFKVSFGRHEKFALRYSWLTKGYQGLEQDEKLFSSDDAIVKLGVGRNMVNSIRYWMTACQIIDDELKSTPVGKAIFDKSIGEDRYLEDVASIWLLHWLIASNPNKATSFYWFFNNYNKPEFTSNEVLGSLSDFLAENIIEGRVPSINTLKSDVAVILSMYSKRVITKKDSVEDSIDSPLSTLGLINKKKTGDIYTSIPKRNSNLPVEILAFAIISILQSEGRRSISIENLLYSSDKSIAPGTVFRLTEIGLTDKLEELVGKYPDIIGMRDVAGVNQITLLRDEINPSAMIKHYINNKARF